MSPPTFAQELIVHITQYCNDDLNTLKNIALVSRDWLPIARDHLFSSITLRESEHGHRLFTFLNFINSGSSINLCVKNITIFVGTASPLDVLELVLKLPNLRSVITSSHRVDPPPNPPTQLVPYLERLKMILPIVLITSAPWRPLFDFISGFAYIGALQLENVFIRQPGPDPFATPPPPPTPTPARKTRVDTLRLLLRTPRFHDEFYAQIVEFIDVKNVRSLHFDTYREDRALLQKVINEAVNLKELSVGLDHATGRESGRLSLEPCKSLEVVGIKIPLGRVDDNGNAVHQEIFADALALITSSLSLNARTRGSTHHHPLAHIWFDVMFPSQVNFDLSGTIKSIRWSDLNDALRPASQLRSVKINLLLSDMDDEAPGSLREQIGADSVSDLVKRDLAGLSRQCVVEVPERCRSAFV